MNKPRRTIRHSGEGPNRHKARVGRKLKLLSERMRDIAIELDLIGHSFKAGQMRAASSTAVEWAGQIHTDSQARWVAA
ncbi:hypothetical protein [Nevskia sp.]|uniref:hypothetical protein n=1 Tax=Nevskia sp. TaxID=1929292 RepID=UPI0025DCA3FC|nr:hypothetical protein [Nevskia sp.]